MRHRSFILLATLLGLLIFGSIAVYAVDAAQEDKIAEGVTVAGVDVGGMKPGEARDAIAQQVDAPLQKPLTVRYKRREFELDPSAAGVKADLDGMVDEAIEKSRDGNMFARVTRSITGGEVNADVPVRVTYDQEVVDKLVKRVERKIERKPTEAKVEFSGSGLKKVRGQPGVTLRADALHQAVGDELVHPSPERLVRARVKTTKPKVGIDDLADKHPTVITIDRGSYTLRLYKKLKLKKTYRIAVGTVGFETPVGLYHVQNKAVNPAWSVPEWGGDLAGQVIPGGAPNNPLKARWLGIYDGAGIHGTDAVSSLGTSASHGCIRMAIPEVIEVYDQVPVGAPVYIA
jgi:lipoprotein-anchoring transpeptidase ErfK/SrfK